MDPTQLCNTPHEGEFEPSKITHACAVGKSSVYNIILQLTYECSGNDATVQSIFNKKSENQSKTVLSL